MSVAIPIVPNVLHVKQPQFPQFRFEWHKHTGKVYVIHIPGKWEQNQFIPDLTVVKAVAVCLAEHCNTEGLAYCFVQTYLRGYRKGKDDLNIGTT